MIPAVTAPAPITIPRLAVLVADPVPHMATLVAGMLRTLKVREIREVGSAAAAMSELRRRPFNVLVLDDSLRDTPSIEFVRRLRAAADCPCRDIPIVMMSAGPDTTEIKAARDAGITEFLRKPFSAQHLEARLTSILTAPRPFIAGPAYTGPDRRRRTATFGGKDRRTAGSRREPA